MKRAFLIFSLLFIGSVQANIFTDIWRYFFPETSVEVVVDLADEKKYLARLKKLIRGSRVQATFIPSSGGYSLSDSEVIGGFVISGGGVFKSCNFESFNASGSADLDDCFIDGNFVVSGGLKAFKCTVSESAKVSGSAKISNSLFVEDLLISGGGILNTVIVQGKVLVSGSLTAVGSKFEDDLTVSGGLVLKNSSLKNLVYSGNKPEIDNCNLSGDITFKDNWNGKPTVVNLLLRNSVVSGVVTAQEGVKLKIKLLGSSPKPQTQGDVEFE